jgi:hypothetical protein
MTLMGAFKKHRLGPWLTPTINYNKHKMDADSMITHLQPWLLQLFIRLWLPPSSSPPIPAIVPFFSIVMSTRGSPATGIIAPIIFIIRPTASGVIPSIIVTISSIIFKRSIRGCRIWRRLICCRICARCRVYRCRCRCSR